MADSEAPVRHRRHVRERTGLFATSAQRESSRLRGTLDRPFDVSVNSGTVGAPFGRGRGDKANHLKEPLRGERFRQADHRTQLAARSVIGRLRRRREQDDRDML